MRSLHPHSGSGSRRWLARCWGGLAWLWLAAATAVHAEKPPLPAAASHTIDFDRDVQPLLKERCLECHGETKQKGGFRLDSRDAALRGGENYSPAIRVGNSAESPLIQLVAGQIADLRMPPKGEALSPDQIGILRAWIDQGAKGSATTSAEGATPKHWSFQPIVRPALPGGPQGTSADVNPVDSFIRAKLIERRLTPAPEADRVTLIRRLYFVLLGLPPTPAEVAAFVSDDRPKAFERLVDKALADPRYGERWARHWLDVIRFAESNGFETNRERPNAWKFRDYVIAAFNDDKPFDRFVREQLAGDSVGSDVGTGFLVGGPFDIVKSPDPVLTAQQRADELDDMVSTTGTAFLGLTLGCARCHSHKFDPISQREYYSMAAVFAGVQHADRALPPTAEQTARRERAEAKIQELEQRLTRFLTPPPAPSTTKTSKRPPVNARENVETFEPLEARFVRFTINASNGGEPCIDELEVWSSGRNVALASNGTVPTASGTLSGYDIHQLQHLNDGRPGNNRSWISDQPGKGWVQLEFKKRERIDRIVWGRDRDGGFGDRVATDYVIEAAAAPGEWKVVASSADREAFGSAASKPPGPKYQFDGLAETDAKQGRAWLAELEATRKERDAASKGPMIWAGTFNQPGPTHRLHRGDPMQKREAVNPGSLGVFKPLNLSSNAPEKERRLALANWVADPSNPLTPRVIVNRLWQHQFGVGLVDTPNDFGRNGTRPTHPELLDWLAAELVHPNGAQPWSIKHIQRLILTSATWRQSSAPRREGLEVDAASRLLWRFPPRRLEAEAIRDSMLAVSGNLDPRAGGPSFFLHHVDRENVYHYHPKEEFGPEDHRRMVYAFKVRMEQDGIFGSFDCPDGSLVVPKRSMSTTPLQALNLFNSQFVLAQAAVFAQRLQTETGADRDAQIRQAWQLAYNRLPSEAERNDAAGLVNDSGLPTLCRALLNTSEFLFIP